MVWKPCNYKMEKFHRLCEINIDIVYFSNCLCRVISNLSFKISSRKWKMTMVRRRLFDVQDSSGYFRRHARCFRDNAVWCQSAFVTSTKTENVDTVFFVRSGRIRKIILKAACRFRAGSLFSEKKTVSRVLDTYHKSTNRVSRNKRQLSRFFECLLKDIFSLFLLVQYQYLLAGSTIYILQNLMGYSI